MGEAGANAEVIDEKLWGDDDKDQDGKDGPNGAPEQEKYERGGAVKAGPQQELEYRGADEAEGGAPEDKPDDVADDKEKEPQAQPQRPDTVAAEDGGAQVNEMENEVEEGTGLQPRGPEGQGDGDDDGVDAEGEADVDGVEEEGGADAEAGAAEEEVPGADADAADDMELEGGQDGEEDAGGDDGRDEVADMEADDDAAAAGEEEHPPDEPGGEPTAPDTDAAPGAEEPQDASSGQRGGARAPQSDDKQRGGTASGRGTFPTQAAPVAPDGPADVDGGGDQGDDFDVEGSDADAGDAADAGAGGAAGSGAGAGAGAGGTQGAVARGGQASRRGPPPPRTRTEPNPYRNLGDALQKWRERLSVRPSPLCVRAPRLGSLSCAARSIPKDRIYHSNFAEHTVLTSTIIYPTDGMRARHNACVLWQCWRHPGVLGALTQCHRLCRLLVTHQLSRSRAPWTATCRLLTANLSSSVLTRRTPPAARVTARAGQVACRRSRMRRRSRRLPLRTRRGSSKSSRMLSRPLQPWRRAPPTTGSTQPTVLPLTTSQRRSPPAAETQRSAPRRLGAETQLRSGRRGLTRRTCPPTSPRRRPGRRTPTWTPAQQLRRLQRTGAPWSLLQATGPTPLWSHSTCSAPAWMTPRRQTPCPACRC